MKKKLFRERQRENEKAFLAIQKALKIKESADKINAKVKTSKKGKKKND